MYFDSHCHIQFKAYEHDRKEVIARAKDADVLMHVVGTQIPTSKKAIALSEQYDHVYASIGIHPIQHDVVEVKEESTSFISKGEQWDEEVFEEMATHPRVIGIGETGLDRFHIRHDIAIEEVFAAQKVLFLQHYALAKKVGKPLVIHVRDAHHEMIELLDELYKKDGPIDGVVHCFTGNWAQAQEYLRIGMHLGFTGVITFPPKKSNPVVQRELQDVVCNIPIDRMLIETDAPYLAPQLYRGKRNEPAYVIAVASAVAKLRGMTLEDVRFQTTKNGMALFSIVS